MRLSGFTLNILLITANCQCGREKVNCNALTIAFRNISLNLFESSRTVHVNKIFSDEDTILKEILESARDENLPVAISYIKEDKAHCPLSAILTLGSMTSPQEYSDLMRYDCSQTPDTILYVHWKNANRSEILQHSQKKFMEKSYFLFEEGEFIELLTFQHFPSNNCRRNDLFVVNRFSIKSLKWESNKFNHFMFSDFYGCDLFIKFGDDRRIKHVRRIYNVSDKATSRYYGLNRKIYEELASNLNYKLNLGKSPREIFVITYYSDMLDSVLSSVMRPHSVESVYFAVPVGQPYNGFEKLALPFDETVWFLIIMTFVTAFTTIFVLKFTPRRVRNFVIGRNITTPTLNVLMAVFGIAQISIPGRNFARFLVMSFILYCLIMRTAWQGKMFEFMQKDMRRPEMKSIEEMEANNFTLCIEQDIYLSRGKFLLGRNVKIISSPTFFSLFPQLDNSSFKWALAVSSDLIKYRAIATNGSFLTRIVKQQFKAKFVGQLFPGPEGKTFDEKIQQLVTGGLIDYYDRDYLEFLTSKRYEHLQNKGPKVLTMEHLKAGFVFCCVPIIFAFVAFLLEWISRFAEFLMVRKTVLEFYRIKMSDQRRKQSLVHDETPNDEKEHETGII